MSGNEKNLIQYVIIFQERENSASNITRDQKKKLGYKKTKYYIVEKLEFWYLGPQFLKFYDPKTCVEKLEFDF